MELLKMLNGILQDYSDVKISYLTGIERTRLNRIKNGKFKIEFDELKKIISALMIDDETAKKLYDAYLYEKLGKDKYNSRQLAKEFMTSMTLSVDNSASMSMSYNVDFNISQDVMTIDGYVNVRQVVQMMLFKAAEKNDKIRLMTSPFNEGLNTILLTVTASRPELEIEHIYSLAATNELPEPLTYYMSVAKAVYPLFMLNTGYTAYYSLVGHATNTLTPYHIITSDFSIELTPDKEHAILLTSKPVIELQKELFEQRKNKCSPFINKIKDLHDYFRHYCAIVQSVSASTSDLYYSLDYEPCVLSQFTDEELKGCIDKITEDKELAQLMNTFLNSFYSTFKVNRQISYFTKDGVRSFVENGTVEEIPDALGLVVSPKRRKEILEGVLKMMKDEKSHKTYYMLNEKEFKPPHGLRFLGSGSKTGHIFVMSNGHDGIRSILSLSNPEIKSIFFDFLESLPETDMVYSHEDMIAYMEETINNME